MNNDSTRTIMFHYIILKLRPMISPDRWRYAMDTSIGIKEFDDFFRSRCFRDKNRRKIREAVNSN